MAKITPKEAAMLRKIGYKPEEIREMSRAEIEELVSKEGEPTFKGSATALGKDIKGFARRNLSGVTEYADTVANETDEEADARMEKQGEAANKWLKDTFGFTTEDVKAKAINLAEAVGDTELAKALGEAKDAVWEDIVGAVEYAKGVEDPADVVVDVVKKAREVPEIAEKVGKAASEAGKAIAEDASDAYNAVRDSKAGQIASGMAQEVADDVVPAVQQAGEYVSGLAEDKKKRDAARIEQESLQDVPPKEGEEPSRKKESGPGVTVRGMSMADRNLSGDDGSQEETPESQEVADAGNDTWGDLMDFMLGGASASGSGSEAPQAPQGDRAPIPEGMSAPMSQPQQNAAPQAMPDGTPLPQRKPSFEEVVKIAAEEGVTEFNLGGKRFVRDEKAPSGFSSQPNLDDMQFGQAFAAARQAGQSNFVWRGKSFHTQTAEELGKMMMQAQQQAPVPQPKPVAPSPQPQAPMPQRKPQEPSAEPALGRAIGMNRTGDEIAADVQKTQELWQKGDPSLGFMHPSIARGQQRD